MAFTIEELRTDLQSAVDTGDAELADVIATQLESQLGATGSITSGESFVPQMEEFDAPALSAPSVVDRMTQSKRDLFAQELGVQPEQMQWDKGAPPGLGRAWAGFMDTDEDRTKAFRSRAYPDAEIKTVQGDQFIKLRKDEPWIPFDEAGLSLGDVYDMVSEVPEIAASVMTTMYGGGVPKAAMAAMAAQTAEEGVKAGAGYTPDVTAPLAVGATEFAGGKLGQAIGLPVAGVSNKLGGRAPAHVLPETLSAYRGVREQFPDAPMLMPHQVSESKILKRSAAQSRYTADEGIIPQERAQQAWSASQLEQLGTPPSRTVSAESQKQALRDVTKQRMGEITKGVPRTTPYTSGKRMKAAVDNDIKIQGKAVSKAYSVTDDVAAIENPVFDLQAVQAKASEIRQGVQGSITKGKEVPNLVSPTGETLTTKFVATKGSQDVSGIPQGELDTVIDDIMQLDPHQLDYKTVKALRTRLYSMTDNPRYGWDANKYQALELYHTLSNSLNNPLNDAPAFKVAIKEASTLARNRFDLMKQSEIRQVLNTSNPYHIGKNIQVGQLTPDLVKSIKRGGDINALQSGLNHNLLDSPNPLETLRNWEMNHPEVFDLITTKSQRDRLTTVVQGIDALRGQEATRIAEQTVRNAETISNIASSYDKKGVAALAARMTTGQKKAFKEGIYMDFLNKTVDYTNKGAMFVNPDKFLRIYRDYQKSGVLSEFMNPTDISRLKALKDYVLMSNGTLKDVGAALEGAKLISQLKDVGNPKTMMKGAIGLKINTLISKFMASSMGNKTMLGWSEKAPFTDKSMRVIGVALAGMKEE